MIVDSQEVARIVQRGPMSPYPGVTFFYQCLYKDFYAFKSLFIVILSL